MGLTEGHNAEALALDCVAFYAPGKFCVCNVLSKLCVHRVHRPIVTALKYPNFVVLFSMLQ